MGKIKEVAWVSGLGTWVEAAPFAEMETGWLGAGKEVRCLVGYSVSYF